MLVLTRKLKQKIQIGKNITITVLRVQGNSVRIGIDAPDNVRVLRAELPVDFREGDEEFSDENTSGEIIALSPAHSGRDFTLEATNPGERTTLRRSLPVSDALRRRRTPNSSPTTDTTHPNRAEKSLPPGMLVRA
jgi:carbon storage regulator CsrA